MENFKTKNQDKSNLVGDTNAKVMSDAVDAVQLAIKQSDVIAELKRQLEEDRIMYAVNIAEMNFKSQVWDMFEELFKNTPPNAILPDWNDTSKSRDFLTINFAKDMSLSDVISQEYNKYLESIKGES